MPSLNQNFVRLEHDSFVLEYISTDSILNTSTTNPSYAAWWGLSDTNDATGNLLLETWSGTGLYGIDSYDVSSGYPDCSTSGLTPFSPSLQPFTLIVFETKVIVLLQYSDFENVPLDPGDYYHELVLMKVVNSGGNSVAHQCRSHVAATGILTLNGSLFTNNPYR